MFKSAHYVYRGNNVTRWIYLTRTSAMIVFTPRARKSKFKHSVGYLSTEFFRKIIHNGRWTKIFATKCPGSRWTKIFATKSQGGDGPKFSRPNVKVAMDQNFRTNIFATKFFATKIFAAKVLHKKLSKLYQITWIFQRIFLFHSFISNEIKT